MKLVRSSGSLIQRKSWFSWIVAGACATSTMPAAGQAGLIAVVDIGDHLPGHSPGVMLTTICAHLVLSQIAEPDAPLVHVDHDGAVILSAFCTTSAPIEHFFFL